MDLITTDSADLIEREYAASKRAKRLGKAAPEKKVPAAEEKKGKKKAAKKAATPLSSAADDVWDNYVRQSMPEAVQDYVPDQVFTPEEEAEAMAEYEQVGKDANRINDYYRQFPETRPPGKPHFWSGMDNSEEIAAELSRCRAIVNGQGGEETVRMAVIGLGKGMEWVVHGYGFNPWNMNLHGMGKTLGMALMQKDNDFEPEIKQLTIEYSDWLASRPEARLAVKLAQFAYMYSEVQNNPKLREELIKAAETSKEPEVVPEKKQGRKQALFKNL